MKSTIAALKAIADGTRLRVVKLLLQYNYCVGALARRLDLTEAAISQHLKVLREAGLLVGEKRGHFMHYDVDRNALRALGAELEKLAAIERQVCKPEEEDCEQQRRGRCRAHEAGGKCPEEVRFACHGPNADEKENGRNGHCECQEPQKGIR
ncbi:MAG: winged helix-turn-helix transcriptional regulator [Firmicutes bacterium]|nr:winged helix-turn-helix transcriptional regulator [Candidatus Fermentithermobacillaceae bacterium]